MRYGLIITLFILFPALVLAQASGSPAPVAVVAPTFLDGILKFLTSTSGLTTGVVVAAELAMRLFPSKNPLSFLVPAKYIVSSLVSILTWIQQLLMTLINAGQNTQL